ALRCLPLLVLAITGESHLFFFSSRRRHTRCYRDWSSDVCSSDLVRWALANSVPQAPIAVASGHAIAARTGWESEVASERRLRGRSEERRVGKECKSGGARYS